MSGVERLVQSNTQGTAVPTNEELKAAGTNQPKK